MHGLVVRVGRELVFAIFVVQISDVIVADACSLVILAREEHAGLGKVNQSDDVRLLSHEFVLSEFVVGDQVAELHLKLQDLFALATLAVQLHIVVIVGLQDLVHAGVQNAQRLDHSVGGLEDAVGA